MTTPVSAATPASAMKPTTTATDKLKLKAQRSEAATAKAAAKRTTDGLPVHSFRSLLGDLATITRNTMATSGHRDATFTLYPQLTAVQARLPNFSASPLTCSQ